MGSEGREGLGVEGPSALLPQVRVVHVHSRRESRTRRTSNSAPIQCEWFLKISRTSLPLQNRGTHGHIQTSFPPTNVLTDAFVQAGVRTLIATSNIWKLMVFSLTSGIGRRQACPRLQHANPGGRDRRAPFHFHTAFVD